MSGKSIKKIIDDYCVIDLETTGLSAKYDSIIEIGIIKIRNNTIVKEYSQLINPGFKIDNYITELTGITDEMLCGMPKIEDVKKDVLSFIENDILIGHNIVFDINFLRNNLDSYLENDYIDTLQLSRKVYTELKHHRLKDMVIYLNLSSNTHRAINDCISTKELYDQIKNEISDKNIIIEDLFKSKNKKHTLDISSIVPTNNVDENNFFYGKHCVFTGKLDKMIRKDAMQLIVNIGGILDKSVTKSTNYLILGNNDYCSSIKNGKSSKQKKAELLKIDGNDIEIIDENTFYELINL